MQKYDKTICALVIGLGIILAGYFIGHGMENFRKSERIIFTKGIGEKEVYADYAIWKIAFLASGEDFEEAKQNYENNLDTILHFLKEQGFDEKVIQIRAPNVSRILSKPSRVDGASQKETYNISGNVLIKTGDVDSVRLASKRSFQLLKQGVWLKESDYGPIPSILLKTLMRCALKYLLKLLKAPIAWL